LQVRIGILSSLSDLFKILPPSKQVEYLPTIKDFLDDHNDRNWRYRLKLTEQLCTMCSFFNAEAISMFITPLAIELAKDKVAELRLAAGTLLCIILQKLAGVHDKECVELLGTLREAFVEDGKTNWKQRLMFIQLCQKMIETECLSWECVERECLPLLLRLYADQVPNVRIAVAKVAKLILADETLCKGADVVEKLMSTLETLKEDSDNDVRCTAGGNPLPRTLARDDSSGSEEPWFQSGDVDEDEDTTLNVSSTGLLMDRTSEDNQAGDIPAAEGMEDIAILEDNVFEAKSLSEPLNHTMHTSSSNCVPVTTETTEDSIAANTCTVQGKMDGVDSDVAMVMSLQDSEDSEC
jgi:serine/threonine-protein phosphatase 4 regulatory subunit 1